MGRSISIPNPHNCPFPWGDLHSHLIDAYLEPPDPPPQMASRSIAELGEHLMKSSSCGGIGNAARILIEHASMHV